MSILRFEVFGKPAPAGSKRGFPIRRKNGQIGVAMADDSKRAKPWQAAVSAAAAKAMAGQPLLNGPVSMGLAFIVARPKGHFGTGRNANRVKNGAPRYPMVKPDLGKLERAILDALTGIVYRDDAQVCEFHQLTKVYGEPEGVAITVREL